MSAAPAPLRIVSLVPSHTETLVHFGLLGRLVGRTRYCVEPAGAVDAVAVVGGTKDPDITAITALAPDLVVINREENRLEDFRALEAAGLRVHVTHPRSLAEAVTMLAELGRVCGAAAAGAKLAGRCRRALRRAPRGPRLPVFCPIWRNPWMTFGDCTYVGDMLRTVGFANVLGAGAGRGDSDFFAVTIEEVVHRQPRVVLLPDEPYVFREKHATELRAAGLDARFFLVSGKDLAWYGPRIPGALERLGHLAVG